MKRASKTGEDSPEMLPIVLPRFRPVGTRPRSEWLEEKKRKKANLLLVLYDKDMVVPASLSSMKNVSRCVPATEAAELTVPLRTSFRLVDVIYAPSIGSTWQTETLGSTHFWGDWVRGRQKVSKWPHHSSHLHYPSLESRRNWMERRVPLLHPITWIGKKTLMITDTKKTFWYFHPVAVKSNKTDKRQITHSQNKVNDPQFGTANGIHRK